MHNNYHTSSLLPYMDELHGKLSLKISLIAQDTETVEKTSIPFLVISDSDPLTRLIEGKIITDAGSEMKKLFLLMQRDKYLLSRDETWPFSNKDVDDLWQKAFSFYAGDKQDHCLNVLSNQINEDGRLTLLQPLFFCKTKQLYFHPPCPKCGLPMQQCEDDNLLTNLGLQAYSHSLKRYLFCPSCGSNNYDFYVYELDHLDPPEIKDRWALIKDFGILEERGKQYSQFPCIKCSDYQKCYSSDYLALSRIVPFSFYPFYMLIFEAMSLNAIDFLSLVSGATIEKLEARLKTNRESGRINYLKAVTQKGSTEIPFFFYRDHRYFLEVLYLKLSFLGEVFQNLILETDPFEHPNLRFSLDRMWVQIAEHNSLLPFLWNFHVKYMDIYGPQFENHSFPRSPTSYGLFYSGILWFYTLLVNKRQDFAKVFSSIKETVSNFLNNTDFSPENLFRENSDPTFMPLNLFWDSEGKSVSSEWNLIWEKALLLGWSLFEGSFRYDPDWSKEKFRQKLQNLREEVKDNLFSGELTDKYLSNRAEDEAICDILEKIVKKWCISIEPAKEEFPVKEELKETVILSPEESDELKETVILSPEVNRKETAPPPSQEVQSDEDDFLEETVILKPKTDQDKGKNEK